MPKQKDYYVGPVVTEIMEKLFKNFPNVFEGFDVTQIVCVHTKDKQNARKPLTLKAVPYPYSVWMTPTYIIEVADKTWLEMSERQRNLTAFKTMCAFPEGAFDPESNNFGKIKKPDYEMYAEEFALTGGVADWMENEDVKDPLTISSKNRKAVTIESVASV